MGGFAVKSLERTDHPQQSFHEVRILKTSTETYNVTHFKDSREESFAVSRKISKINQTKEQTTLRVSATLVSASQHPSIMRLASMALEYTQAGIRASSPSSPMQLFAATAAKEKPSAASQETGQLSAADMQNLKGAFREFEFNADKALSSPHLKPQIRSDLEEFKKTVKQLSAEMDPAPAEENKPETKADSRNTNVSDLFWRFCKLWQRIIAQADGDAFNLYQIAKERTDQCDRLNRLYSELLATNGKVDWSKNEEMKKLVEEARALGVVIPEGKNYQWSEEQKKNFIENIRTKKESLDKITQMEKTDLQRYMQTSTNGYEWLSNMLKLWERVASLLSHNIKPG